MAASKEISAPGYHMVSIYPADKEAVVNNYAKISPSGTFTTFLSESPKEIRFEFDKIEYVVSLPHKYLAVARRMNQ